MLVRSVLASLMSTLLYLVQELAGIAGGVNVVGVCRVIIYLFSHINRHHLSNDLQSAYKRFLSIETALLKIHNDIVDNTDNGKVTALTLLDISAAFDKIDHLILLQRLHRHVGISGTGLRWFKSYFSDRHQSINIFGTLSCPQNLPFGVPQRSVLGPVLFS